MTQENLCKNHKPTPLSNPIAASGDKNQIPASSSDDGVVNVTNGIPSRYSLPRAAGGKSMGRRDMNGLFNLVSQPEYFQQYMGRTLWDPSLAATGYPKGAKVFYYDENGTATGEYESDGDNNTSTPGTTPESGAKWIAVGGSIGSDVMTLSGNQTVTGTKTFNVSPTVPTIEQSSLSETGTRAVNEATLLGAISGSSTGGFFFDPTYGTEAFWANSGTTYEIKHDAFVVASLYASPYYSWTSSVIDGAVRIQYSTDGKNFCTAFTLYGVFYGNTISYDTTGSHVMIPLNDKMSCFMHPGYLSIDDVTKQLLNWFNLSIEIIYIRK